MRACRLVLRDYGLVLNRDAERPDVRARRGAWERRKFLHRRVGLGGDLGMYPIGAAGMPELFPVVTAWRGTTTQSIPTCVPHAERKNEEKA